MANEEAMVPPVDTWPQRPILIQPIGKTKLVNQSSHEDFLSKGLVGRVFDFETELFRGRALIRLKGISAMDSDIYYFDGRKRKAQIIIQGRFLQGGIQVNDIVMGREFTKPLRFKPPSFVDGIIRRTMAKKNMQMQLSTDTPVLLFPLVANIQTVRADTPGSEPDPSTWADGITENNQGFGPHYAKQVKQAKDRKRVLTKENDSDYVFSTGMVYTFEDYSHILDYSSYKMDFGMFQMDMSKILNREPFHCMAKSQSLGKHLWAFAMWHENLLDELACQTPEENTEEFEKIQAAAAVTQS